MLNPKPLYGEWAEGYSLDIHTLRSTRLPDDDWGHPQFDTVRTNLGELIYRMKYNGHQDTTSEIVELCSDFMKKWLSDKNINVVIPVPPSIPRQNQPVFLLANAVADWYGATYVPDDLEKTSEGISKEMNRTEKKVAVSLLRRAAKPCNVLLIDDLVDTGTTANACVRALRQDKNVRNIYFMAFTRRRT